MTNQELFAQAKKTIINVTGTVKYMQDLAREMGLVGQKDWANTVIDKMVDDYNSCKDASLMNDRTPADFALYINLTVNY